MGWSICILSEPRFWCWVFLPLQCLTFQASTPGRTRNCYVALHLFRSIYSWGVQKYLLPISEQLLYLDVSICNSLTSACATEAACIALNAMLQVCTLGLKISSQTLYSSKTNLFIRVHPRIYSSSEKTPSSRLRRAIFFIFLVVKFSNVISSIR